MLQGDRALIISRVQKAEVYPQSVYEVPDKAAIKFVSVLSFGSSEHIDPNYLHFQYGMSKDLACGGLRLGVFHTGIRS